ncbi:hypothetical protein GGI21_004369, partial [Coemansia aciculifera]
MFEELREQADDWFEDHGPDEQPVRHNNARDSLELLLEQRAGENSSSGSYADEDDDDDDDDDEEDDEYAWSVVSTSESPTHGGDTLHPLPPPTFTAESSRGITAQARDYHDEYSDEERERYEQYYQLGREYLPEEAVGPRIFPPLRARPHTPPADIPPPADNPPPPPPPPDNNDAFEDEMGDIDGVDGMLEAMGFRGQIMDSVQYFVLVLSMVSLVLACVGWIPFVVGRVFVSLNPLRWALYVVYVCTAAVDAVSEFVLDRLLPVAEVIVNLLGPAFVFVMPGISEALQAAQDSGSTKLWDQLGSAAVRQVVLERVRQSWAMQVLFPLASAGVAPTPTTMAGGDLAGLDPAVLAVITRGECSVWQRFVRWGVPVDRVAAWLMRATAGATLDDRLAMIGAGHVVLLCLAWVFVARAPRGLRRTAVYGHARVAVLMAKVLYFIVVELVLFPALCGVCLAVSVAPVVQALSPMGGWARVVVYWLAGLGFMVHFARFVLYCRQVLRPGVLWFIRDPNDPEFHPMREILEDRMAPQQHKIARSAVMYCTIIAACVLAPAHFAARLAPEGTLPIAMSAESASRLAVGSSHTWLILL